LDLLDQVSVLRGKHAFKYGGEIILNTAEPFHHVERQGQD